jgi:hypothetical protein
MPALSRHFDIPKPTESLFRPFRKIDFLQGDDNQARGWN